MPPTGKKCKYMTDDHEGAWDRQSAERSVAGSPKKRQPSPQSSVRCLTTDIGSTTESQQQIGQYGR